MEQTTHVFSHCPTPQWRFDGHCRIERLAQLPAGSNLGLSGDQAQRCLGRATGLETWTESGTKRRLHGLWILALVGVLAVLHESIIGNHQP
jgi:hypothetical protein